MSCPPVSVVCAWCGRQVQVQSWTGPDGNAVLPEMAVRIRSEHADDCEWVAKKGCANPDNARYGLLAWGSPQREEPDLPAVARKLWRDIERCGSRPPHEHVEAMILAALVKAAGVVVP